MTKSITPTEWPEGKLYLNLGCGAHAPKGWVNIDRSPQIRLSRHPRVRSVLRSAGVLHDQHMGDWPRNVIQRDLTKPLPVADGVASAAYSSHMLEHLFLDDARAFLRECARVMRPGAVLRMALPDAEQFARDLLDAAEDPDGEAGRAYNDMLRAHPDSKPSGRRLLAYLAGSNWHKWQPARGLVKRMLRDAGFGDVEERSFREGALPELEVVELRRDSWFVEGVRMPAGQADSPSSKGRNEEPILVANMQRPS
jgi:SAM-dependent methyltransferase